jgi:hypothetical protein
VAVRRRRKRWPFITGIIVLVIVILLAVADRVANAITENAMASQFQTSVGLSGKPNVTIQGFPFLTQLAAKDFGTVNISASNESVNQTSGVLEIASLTATLHGMHIHSFTSKSATVDSLEVNALITFTALGNAGGIPQGVTLTNAGQNEIKATIDLGGVISGSATAKVTQVGSNQINVHLIDAGGIPADALGSLSNFSVSIPKLPAGVSIQSVSVTQQGLRVIIAGHNTNLSQ